MKKVKDTTGLTDLTDADSRAVKIGEETVEAKKFRLKQFTKVFTHVAALRGAFQEGRFDVEKALDSGQEHVYALVQLSTGKDQKWFEAKDDELPDGVAEEFVDLVTKVVDVNWDTIGKKIFQAAQRFADKVDEFTPQATGLM